MLSRSFARGEPAPPDAAPVTARRAAPDPRYSTSGLLDAAPPVTGPGGAVGAGART